MLVRSKCRKTTLVGVVAHISEVKKKIDVLFMKCLAYHYNCSLQELPLHVGYIIGHYTAGNTYAAKATSVKTWVKNSGSFLNHWSLQWQVNMSSGERYLGDLSTFRMWKCIHAQPAAKSLLTLSWQRHPGWERVTKFFIWTIPIAKLIALASDVRGDLNICTSPSKLPPVLKFAE